MSVFNYKDYRKFLTNALRDRAHEGVNRSVISKSIGCQPSHISAVLSGNAHLSSEQTERLARFLNLDESQAEYLLNLVHFNRAGTRQVAVIYERMLNRMRETSSPMRGALKIGADLSEIDKAKYYSSWIYSVVHVMISVEELTTLPALAKRLRRDVSEIESVVEFLVAVGLVQKAGADSYRQRQPLLHIDRTSPSISRHHTNLRLKSIEVIERNNPDNFHYSGVVSLSRSDVVVVKQILMDALKSAINVIKDSQEEDVAVIAMDFFGL